VGFPQDIFDLNVFPVATGMEEHRLNALDFFRGTKWVRENLPHAHISGEVMFHSHLEEMIQFGKRCTGLVSCDSKRNDDGNRKSRNAFYL
jgi:hypothetical protein